MPKDRERFYFKLRHGVQKKVVVSVQQLCNKELGIERLDALQFHLVHSVSFCRLKLKPNMCITEYTIKNQHVFSQLGSPREKFVAQVGAGITNLGTGSLKVIFFYESLGWQINLFIHLKAHNPISNLHFLYDL